MKALDPQKALVVFSGGQDSTTCLWWAKQKYESVEAVSFDYGQRHHIELKAAKKIATLAQVPWQCLPLDLLSHLGGNSLVDSSITLSKEKGEDALPQTFVPGRNLLFLTAAAALAYQLNSKNLVTGVCQTDYSGYPDCRETTIKALEASLQQGMDCDIHIQTPLMHLTKSQTIELASQVRAIEALAWSHTCYQGVFPPCGQCEACLLRSKGFQEAGLTDPLLERS